MPPVRAVAGFIVVCRDCGGYLTSSDHDVLEVFEREEDANEAAKEGVDDHDNCDVIPVWVTERVPKKEAN